MDISPDLDDSINQLEDFELNIEIKYFIPEYNWQKLGYAPELRIHNRYNNMVIQLLDTENLVFGEVAIAQLNARVIAPYDCDEFELGIELCFMEVDGNVGLCLPQQMEILVYQINDIGYKPPSIELVSVLPKRGTILPSGEDYSFTFIIKYYLHDLDKLICKSEKCYPNYLTIMTFESISDYGYSSYHNEYTTGNLQYDEFSEIEIQISKVIPQDREELQFIIELLTNSENDNIEVTIDYPISRP